MSTVEEIKTAITKLTPEERAEIARCLSHFDADQWDEQHDELTDAVKAELDEARRDIAEGRFKTRPSPR